MDVMIREGLDIRLCDIWFLADSNLSIQPSHISGIWLDNGQDIWYLVWYWIQYPPSHQGWISGITLTYGSFLILFPGWDTSPPFPPNIVSWTIRKGVSVRRIPIFPLFRFCRSDPNSTSNTANLRVWFFFHRVRSWIRILGSVICS